MRIISINVNGIRSAAKKGLFGWLEQQAADIVCLQEVRADLEQLTDQIFYPAGYHYHFFSSHKKGYGGVAIYCKQKPDSIVEGLGWKVADEEGRYIEARFADLCVASIYLPSGTSGDVRQALKYEFMDHYLDILRGQLQSKRKYIICGDWNIAHTKNDIKNWRANQDHSGFLPRERAWLDVLFDEIGYIDAFRSLHPEKVEYTWWSNRGKAWENNTGWRIDYQILSPNLRNTIKHTSVYREEKFSDHAPLVFDYELNL